MRNGEEIVADLDIVDEMQFVGLGIVVCAAFGAWFVISRQQRKAVKELLAREDSRGPLTRSPMEELFQSAHPRDLSDVSFNAAVTSPAQIHEPAGVTSSTAEPSPGPVASLSDASIGDPSEPPAQDLGALFQGIEMPCGLTPFGVLERHEIAFQSPSPVADIRVQLDAEFERLGMYVFWSSDTTANVSKGGAHAKVELISHPLAIAAASGGQRFPTATQGNAVVLMRMA